MDEFHLLLKEEQTASYSVEIWKRFRKWGGIPTGITQNVKDLLFQPRGGKHLRKLRLHVCESLNTYQTHTHLLFALESMHNLAQNGRVSKLAATMASVLGIRAIGQASAEGTLEMLGKCRGLRKARQFMLSEMVELGYKGGKVRIGHCQNAALALELCTEIQQRFPEADVRSYPLRGLCSYYAERGGIMLGFES